MTDVRLRRSVRRARAGAALAAALLLLAAPAALRAAGPVPATGARQLFGASTPAAADTGRTAADVSPESPRASVAAFLQLARERRYELAARYLPTPPLPADDAAERARRLRVVLDQRLALDLARVSGVAAGDTTDGMPTRDRIGVIAGPDGRPRPVRLEQRTVDGLVEWVFDSATVAQVDAWYDALPESRYRTWMPAVLLEEGPGTLYRWQWLGLLVAACLAALLAAIVALSARFVLAQVVARTATAWDDLLVDTLRAPFRLWLFGMFLTPLTATLALNVRANGLVDATVRGVVIVALFWGALRVVGLAQEQLLAGPWAAAQPQARTLVPLLGRFMRVTVAFLALLVVLAQFGYPVTTLLAGLGIGGIALALAAQKTVENLFGSMSLAADRAFHVGDYVRVGDLEGTVERIGLRSTSFRTRARTIVRIPNGRLAEERIETFGERDRFLFEHFVGLTYDTPRETIRAVQAAIEARLREEPSLWPETVVVRLTAFGESAVTLRIFCWFELTEFTEFLAVQERVLYDVHRIVTTAGASFAFPSRTVYHVEVGAEGAPTRASDGDEP